MAYINSQDLTEAIGIAELKGEIELLEILYQVKANVADGALRELANDQYGTDDVEIDDEPATSEANTGTWVQAWVFVRNEEDETDDHSGED